MPGFPHLFAPLTVGRLSLRNRILSSAHGTRLAEGAGASQVDRGLPGSRLLRYHQARARGGVALIITEPAVVFPLHRPWLAAWTPIIDEVHQHGARIFSQLIYGGRQTSGAESLRPPYGPSPLPWRPGGEYPRPMTVANIRAMVRSFAETAAVAAAAGFDGVEIHGAHGYLVHEFLSPDANHRTDEYGGPVENRARFAQEIVEAVGRAVGDSLVVGIRLSAEEHLAGGLGLDDSLAIIRLLTAGGRLDYVSISAGSYPTMDRIIPGMYHGRAVNRALGRAVKEAFPGLVTFLAGRIADPAIADQLVAEEAADMVAMTRALIADPDLPRKAENGREDDIRFCMGVNQGCWGRVRADFPIGCVLNPEAGREGPPPRPVAPPARKRALVIGGGPAGCEAARSLARRGHQVTLWESREGLGGMTRVAARAPGREDLSEVARWYGHELARLDVKVELGRFRGADEVEALGPDLVVIATGAVPIVPRIPGLDGYPYWLPLPEALDRGFDPGPEAVVFSVSQDIDALSLLDQLAWRGARVTLVTPHDALGAKLDDATRPVVLRRLAEHGVTTLRSATLVGVAEDGLTVADVFTGRTSRLPPPDTLVIDVGWQSDRRLADDLAHRVPALPRVLVGDCLSPRGIQAAVWDGARAAEDLR